MTTFAGGLPQLGGIWVWIALVVVAVLGAGRATRLIVHDTYPPAAAVREWWMRLTWNRSRNEPGGWSKLVTCHWCASPYVFAFVLFTAWLTDLHWGWWLFWGWLAGSYLTAMVVERDEKD